MVELSIRELYSSNRRKIGEILFDPTHEEPKASKSFLLARLPGGLVISPKTRLEFVPTRKLRHVQLYGCENFSAS